MLYQEKLAEEHIRDAYREAENERLFNEIKAQRKNTFRRYLSKLACQVGLITAC